MVLFSFIITVNSEIYFIDRCLSSFFSQTFNDFEIICVNNNLNNKVLKTIESYQSKKTSNFSISNPFVLSKSKKNDVLSSVNYDGAINLGSEDIVDNLNLLTDIGWTIKITYRIESLSRLSTSISNKTGRYALEVTPQTTKIRCKDKLNYYSEYTETEEKIALTADNTFTLTITKKSDDLIWEYENNNGTITTVVNKFNHDSDLRLVLNAGAEDDIDIIEYSFETDTKSKNLESKNTDIPLKILSFDPKDTNIYDKCIKESNGEYICFFESRQYLNKTDSLEKLTDYIKKYDYSTYSTNIALSNYNLFKPIHRLYTKHDYEKIQIYDAKDYINHITLFNNIFKKEIFEKDKINLHNIEYGEKILLFREILKNSDKFISLPMQFVRMAFSKKQLNSTFYIDLTRNYRKLLSAKDYSDDEKEELSTITKKLLKFLDREVPDFTDIEYRLFEKEINTIRDLLDKNDFEFTHAVNKRYRYLKDIIYNRINDFDVLISIIIPTYNLEEYLDDCLMSLINQTFKNIEIIIVDDESTDSTRDIINYYLDKDIRIKYIHKGKKSGSGGSRNLGMKHARGKYIQFVDGDDWLDVDALEKLYAYAEKYQAQTVMFKALEYDDETQTFIKYPYYTIPRLNKFNNKVFNIDDLTNELFRIAVVPWNKLYLRSFLDDLEASFPENYIHQDNPFFFQTFCGADKVYLTDEYFYNRRRRAGSITTKRDDTELGTIEIIEEILKVFLNNKLYETNKKALLNRLLFKLKNRNNLVGEEYKEEYYKRTKQKLWKFIFEYDLWDDLVKNLYGDNKRYFERTIYTVDYQHFLDESK